MFSRRDYERMYERILGPLSQTVTLKVNNGTSYTNYDGVRAHVSSWKENELVNDGPVEVGDLRLIIMGSDLPTGVELMTQKDRVDINGKTYAVMHWDVHSRSIGGDMIAVQATVRGGGPS